MVETQSAILEVCVDSIAGIQACADAGADRIELCSALDIGGLTPSAGILQLATQSSIPVHAMIRPRAGNFCFNNMEIETMCHDITVAAEAGVKGVVLGAATENNTLDLNALTRLSSASGSLHKTLHRVIDTMADPYLAIDQAIDLGFDSVLTSGGQPRVECGIDQLTALNQRASGRLQVIAGGGLTPALVQTISDKTGIRNYHASCRRAVASDENLTKLGFASEPDFKTDVNLIRQFKQSLLSIDT